MKSSNTILAAMALAIVGGGAGYVMEREKKGKKSYDKMAVGALIGGLVGLMAGKLTEDKENIKLSIPQNVTIERT